MQTIASLGIDFGGTRLRLLGLNARGEAILRRDYAAPRLQVLPEFLHHHLPLNIKTLVIGARGVWTQKERNALRTALAPLARRIIVLSDVELAHLALFNGKAGIVVIAGTGSIALGRNENGDWARAGGLGEVHGDPGSGYWMGRQWMKHSKKLSDERSVSAVAALAPEILQKAEEGRKGAQKIALAAAGHLAVLAAQVKGQLNFRRTVPVAGAGGLFKDKLFARMFKSALRKTFPKAKVNPGDGTAFEETAARLGLRPANSALGLLNELQKVANLRR